jgi:hypothetical protein
MKMNRTLALLLTAILAVCGAQAQSVDEIVNKHIAAMGGRDKLKEMKTSYTEGIMEMHGMEIPVKLWVVNDKAVRMELEVMGMSNIQVATRTGGWMQAPAMGITEPKAMDSGMVKLMQPRLDLAGELFDYKTKGKKVSLEGKETTNGVEAYKLKVTQPDGTAFNLFIDAATYYLDKMQGHVNVKGQETEFVVTFTDYKKTTNGYAYPTSTTQEPAGTKISITKMEVNGPLDDTLFQMPKK